MASRLEATLRFIGREDPETSKRVAREARRSAENFDRFIHSDASLEFLQSVSLIPYSHLDVHDQQEVDALACIHYSSNHAIMRGLTADRHWSFLSISFWNYKEPHRSMLMLCVFDAGGRVSEMIMKYDHTDGRVQT